MKEIATIKSNLKIIKDGDLFQHEQIVKEARLYLRSPGWSRYCPDEYGILPLLYFDYQASYGFQDEMIPYYTCKECGETALKYCDDCHYEAGVFPDKTLINCEKHDPDNCENCQNYDGPYIYIMNIDDHDRLIFPDISKNLSQYKIYYSDQGFVYGEFSR